MVLLITVFGITAIIFAWQNPTVAPPGGNLSGFLNTSSTAQTKTGALTIATSTYLATTGGNVGIGTTTPGSDVGWASPALDISGSRGTAIIRTTGAAGLATLRMTGPGASSVDDWHINMAAGAASSLTFNALAGGGVGANILVLKNTGNVGIGTAGPNAKLEVAGNFIRDTMRYITESRTLTQNVGDWVNVGSFANNGVGNFGKVTLYTHACGVIQMASYSFAHDAYSSGSSATWIELPPDGPNSLHGDTQAVAVDVYNADRGTTASPVQMRLRTKSGTCGSMGVTVLIETNAAFTASTTSGSGASVATGYLGSKQWMFPASTGPWNPTTEGLFIQSNGNVGIGTTGPGAKLHISSGDTSLALFGPNASWGGKLYVGASPNQGAALTAQVIATDGNLHLDPAPAKNIYIGYYQPAQGIYMYAYTTFYAGHGDLAENYPVSGKTPRGALVSIATTSPSTAISSSNTYPSLLGVISTAPGAIMDVDGGFQIGGSTKSEYNNEKAPIALTGAVPALVTSQNGSIGIGDAISISNIPGYGAKMITAGNIVGKALQKIDTESCPAVSSIEPIVWPEDDGKNTLRPCFLLPDGTVLGKIMVAVAPSWYDPDIYLTDTGDLNISQDNSGNYVVEKTGSAFVKTMVDKVGAFGQLIAANIRAGLVIAKEVTSKKITVENLSVKNLELVDQITGGIYCVGIKNGEWFKEKGSCQ